MKIACIIPARVNSSRFPKKIFASLAGKSVIQRVWEAAKEVPFFDTVAFAIDASETASHIDSFGGTYFMTSVHASSGTTRLAELKTSGRIDADIFVNWQGDEPFIHAAMIEDLLQSIQIKDSDVWTLKKKITDPFEISNPHIAKVVTDENGYALYFSRNPIPYYRDGLPQNPFYFKHVGIYAYTASALEKISHFTPSFLETAECLEQLTFLYHGLKVHVHETVHEVFGIDLPEHLVKAEDYFLQMKKS